MRTYLAETSNRVVLALAVVALVVARPVLRLPVGWALVALGVLIFLAFEYGMHRFLLHAPRSKRARFAAFQHRIHYGHHEVPNQLDLLWAPLWFTLPVAAPNVVLYLLITRSVPISAALFAGNMLGLAYYEWVHYVAHVPITPRTAFGRYVKKVHLWHHFKNEHYWFGVTSPALDRVVGTYRRPEQVEASPTVRNLFPDPQPGV